MTQVAKWVQDLVEDVMGPSPMMIGADIRHPDGYMVRIISGQLWGEHGLSDWWTWRRIKDDGSLGREVSGYGW